MYLFTSMSWGYFCFNSYFFVWEAERQNVVLTYILNVCNRQGWAKPNPGEGNLIQKSHVVNRDQTIWGSLPCPRTVISQESKQDTPKWDVKIPASILSFYTKCSLLVYAYGSTDRWKRFNFLLWKVLCPMQSESYYGILFFAVWYFIANALFIFYYAK